jgi:hypothetical protein
LVETSGKDPVLTPPRPCRRWRARHAAGAGLSLALLALIFGLGALIAVLSIGRLNLDAFRPLLASSLQERLGPGYRVEIGGIAVERQEHGLALSLDSFVVLKADGRRIITAPKADLIFDPLSLLAGRLNPSRVELDDLAVELRVLPDGGLDLNAGDAGAPTNVPLTSEPAPQSSAASPDPQVSVAPPTSAPTATRAKVLKQAGAAINSVFDIAQGGASPIASLDHFGVRRGRLTVADQAAGQTRGFDDFEFQLDRGRHAGKGVADVRMSARGPSGRWLVKGFARGARGEPHDLAIEASGFSIDEIALLAGKTSLPIDSDIPISLKVAASFEGDGHAVEANARLALGDGFWRFDDPEFAPVFLDEVFAAAHWDGGARRVVVDEAQVFSGQTRFFLKGVVTPPAQESAPWSIAFEQLEHGVIGPDRAGEKSVTLTTFKGAVTLAPNDKILTFERIEAIGPEVAMAMQGTADWVNGPHLRLGISAGRSSAAGVLALWPGSAGAPVRGWVGDHVLGGILESARMTVDLDDADLRMMRAQRPPMDDRISIDYTVKDASFTFMDDAPPVIALDGQGHSSGRASRFTASTAGMESAPGRRIDLSDGLMSMPDLLTQPLDFSVSARAKGSLDTLAEILAKPGFAKVASLPLDPKTTKGQFDGTFTYRTKLKPVYDPALSSIEVAARVENFSAERLVGKEKLDQATLNVSVKNNVTRVTGTGKLFGSPAQIDFTRNGSEPSQGAVSFVMDEAARARAGLPFGATVAGPIAVKATGEVGVARAPAQVELDLTKAGLLYPLPGLYKPAGRAGKATFSYREDERGGANIDQILFDAAGQSAKGALQLAADGAVASAKFPLVKFSPGDNMQAEATRAGDTIKVAMKGAALDARPFLKSLTSSGDSGRDSGNVDLDLSATLLSGANRQIVSNAELRLAKRGANFQSLSFSGKLGGDAVQGVMLRGDDGAPVLRLTTSDAGALLAFLDAYSRMEGGRLRSDIRLGDNLSGSVDIDNFVLRGEPAVKSFATAPAAERFAARAKLDPNVVSFSRLHALLSKNGTRLTVRDGTISSPTIGSTLEGWVDFDRDALDLSGVFVPAYGVNNLFGQLPIFGALLGGQQEGLIGVNFRVTGRASDPSLSVNPLSAIAPGFLRKIFGVLPL